MCRSRYFQFVCDHLYYYLNPYLSPAYHSDFISYHSLPAVQIIFQSSKFASLFQPQNLCSQYIILLDYSLLLGPPHSGVSSYVTSSERPLWHPSSNYSPTQVTLHHHLLFSSFFCHYLIFNICACLPTHYWNGISVIARNLTALIPHP